MIQSIYAASLQAFLMVSLYRESLVRNFGSLVPILASINKQLLDEIYSRTSGCTLAPLVKITIGRLSPLHLHHMKVKSNKLHEANMSQDNVESIQTNDTFSHIVYKKLLKKIKLFYVLEQK